jgi:hypothetical protein
MYLVILIHRHNLRQSSTMTSRHNETKSIILEKVISALLNPLARQGFSLKRCIAPFQLAANIGLIVLACNTAIEIACHQDRNIPRSRSSDSISDNNRNEGTDFDSGDDSSDLLDLKIHQLEEMDIHRGEAESKILNDDDVESVFVFDEAGLERIRVLQEGSIHEYNFKDYACDRNHQVVTAHLYKQMKDHFGWEEPPSLKLSHDDFIRLECDDRSNNSWSSDLKVEYTIDNQSYLSDRVAVDNVYISTISMSPPGDEDIISIDKAWVQLFIPVKTMQTINKYVNEGGNLWKFQTLESSNIPQMLGKSEPLVSVLASMSDDACPEFSFINLNTGGLSSKGSVQAICDPNNPSHGIHKCTAFLSVSLHTTANDKDVSIHQTSPSTPTASGASLKFKLLSVIAYRNPTESTATCVS